MGLKIAVVGCGQFSKSFIPLFQAHPWVDEVVVADRITQRAEETAKKFKVRRYYQSLEEVCASDVDAVALFTQRHLHGPQTLQALRAGKHVYCAVPMAHSLEDVNAILSEVKASGLIYMSGETSYYYPSTVYCRDRFRTGDFGDFVYGEAQYLHDMTHGFYDAFQFSGGEEWKKVAGFPPMYYPTHSVSMILSVTGSHATKVSCLGYRDRAGDGVFAEGANLWNNPFSNETALVRTADGGMCRFNEFRRVGWSGNNSVYLSMFGTEGSYEEHGKSQIWTTLQWGHCEEITDRIACAPFWDGQEDDDADLHAALQADFNSGFAAIHATARLPLAFANKPNGHFGSHQFLADDFVKAVALKQLPPTHAWNAAKYCVPGIVAHDSAIKDGELLTVPSFGEAPEGSALLDPANVIASRDNRPSN